MNELTNYERDDPNRVSCQNRVPKSVFRFTMPLIYSFVLAISFCGIGLSLGYEYVGGIIYDSFPSYFDNLYQHSFPAKLSSKIRLAAIVDVTVVCGWAGLVIGGAAPFAWTIIKSLRRN